ncbi:MerR family transcriptional regulator [Paenibacillus dendritiformis]|uniref:MerR family transcriptional regulator n=1 Tax=Paenibacillus dendritiformis TaxID=130049 RepID=UPI0018CD5276
MYRIGDVTEMANISRRTLHYYNEIGLLHPAKVEGNSYRYYDDAALMKLQKIILLKSLGFTLEQIKQVFRDTGQADKENEGWIQALEARELEDGRIPPVFSAQEYTGEELAILSRLPDLGSADPRAEQYIRLMGAIREQMDAPPASPQAQHLAKELYEMALSLFQGNAALLDKYWSRLVPEEGQMPVVYGHDRELMAYADAMIDCYLQTSGGEEP